MRSKSTLCFASGLCLVLATVGCGGGGGNDVEPHVIPGGGIGDGAIDGEVNIYVIDNQTDLPISGAMVGVGDLEAMAVDETGLAIVPDVKGAQTIAVKAAGYRSAVWVGANGANVTIPLTKLDPVVAQATLTGTIAGFDTFTVAANHVKAAGVLYAQSDNLGDEANNLATPNGENFCVGTTTCDWTLVSRTGSLHVIAALLDIDPMGTAATDDDTITVRGWAMKQVTVADGANQSGIVLDAIELGNLDTVTVDLGTPPAALPETGVLVGIEVSDDEVIQLPMSFLSTDGTTMLAPKLAVFPGSTYRLTGIAQTTAGDADAQSIVIHRRLTSNALAAGTWLAPPTGVTITRTTAAWTPIPGALVAQASWEDTPKHTLLEISVFDPAATSVTVPSLVALPATGTLTGRVGGIAATIDPMNFSLDADRDKLTGIAAQPMEIQ